MFRVHVRKASLLSVAFILMLQAALLQGTSSSASTIVFHYQQPSLAGISGHTATDVSGIPNDKAVCYAYGLGGDALDEAITWNVEDFTGLSVTNKLASQRGVDNGWYGSNACQIEGTSMGFQLHKDSSTDSSPIGNIYGLQHAYQWSSATVRPWSSTAYGSNAQLRLQTNFTLGPSDRIGSGIVQYSQLFVSVADLVNHKSIWYVIFLWDSRGVQPEIVMADTGGTTNYNVVTHIANSTRYVTKHPHSQLSNGSGTGSWYGAYITKANLLNAIADINSTFPSAGFSTNPDDYAINFIGAGLEMYAPPGTTGWVGGNISDVIALTEY